MTPRTRSVEQYRARRGAEPNLVARAPGRVNLIGEHTDYNDGFVLPMALPFEIVIAGTARSDRQVVAASEGFEPISFDLDEPISADGWQRYVHGTATILIDEGFEIGGWDANLVSDIPAGASLSSSAALEVASGLAFLASAGSAIDPARLARVGQRVENEIMHLPSGIMDQLASAASVVGTASLIDCRDLTTTAVELPANVDIVIMDTGTRRELVDSQYADRRADCETAASAIGVTALRDAQLTDLAAISNERVRRRAHHVITENQRTLDAVEAMRSGDGPELGRLMSASHTSLRDDFAVSGPALDHIVEIAQAVNGCLGARMTGGGFAGAAVALVESSATDTFVATVLERFSAPEQQPALDPARLYPVQPCAGASVLQHPPR